MQKKIRISYLSLQFLAIWLFAHGIMVLLQLTNVDAFETVRLSNSDLEGMTTGSLVKAHVTIELGYTIGGIVGLAASLLIMRATKESCFNSILGFCLFVLLGWASDIGWHSLKNLFLAPGSMFGGAAYYLINGLVMIVLAILCLHLTNRLKSVESLKSPPIQPHSA